MTTATTLSWALPNSGSFDAAANWTPADSPASEFDTLIAAPGSYTVSVDAASAARSVTLSDAGATLAIGRTLGIGTTVTLSAGTLALDFGGTIHGGTIVAQGGSTSFNGGTLDGVTYQGTLSLAAPNQTLLVANGITLQGSGGVGPGSVALTGAGSQLEFTNAANLGDAALTIGDPAGRTGEPLSSLVNDASASTGIVLTLEASLSVINGSGADYSVGFAGNDEIDSKTALAFNAPGDASAIDGSGIFLDEGGISIGGGASLVVGDGISAMTLNDKAGVIVASGGSFTINASVTTTGTGAIALNAGGFAELGSSYAHTVTFGSGGGAKLLIDTASQFTGTLADLAAGDIINPGTTVTNATLSATQLVLTTSSGNITYAVSMPAYTGNLLLAPDASGDGTDVVVPCFVAGTRIATVDGDRPVESLAEGDLVRTAGGAVRPVVWVGRRRVDCANHADPDLMRPIRVRAHAFGIGLPARDLLLSPDHAVFVDGLLIPVRLLVNHASIAIAKNVRTVEYVHVELPAHDILLAEGLPAESYLDTGHRATLLPSGAAVRPNPSEAAQIRFSRSCASLATDAARVEPIWRRIAAAVGGPPSGVATTADPDLRLLHRGRSLRPIRVADGRHLFAVAGGGTARLVSRASRPSDTQPWRDDRRRLGVRVSRIVARGTGEITLPLDDPALRSGWWDPDAHGDGRWTDGDAELPVASGTMLLELTVRPLDLYRLEMAGAAV